MTVIITDKNDIMRAAGVSDDGVEVFYVAGPGIPLSLLGNIYQGIVRRVDGRLKAFFVDIGVDQNVLVKICAKDVYQEGQACIIEITRDAPLKKDTFKGARGKIVSLPNQELPKGPACLAVRNHLQDFIGEHDVVVDTPRCVAILRTAGMSPDRITFTPNADLFESYDVADTWASAVAKTVSLPSGGEIVFDDTTAMTVIDVNSSGIETATRAELKTINRASVIEISKQIRWRHLFGMILIDFIGGRQEILAQNLVDDMTRDCAMDEAVTVHGITRLGLMEITRQQTGVPLSYLANI